MGDLKGYFEMGKCLRDERLGVSTEEVRGLRKTGCAPWCSISS